MLRKILKSKTQPLFRAILPAVSRKGFANEGNENNGDQSKSQESQSRKSFFHYGLLLPIAIGVPLFGLWYQRNSSNSESRIVVKEDFPVVEEQLQENKTPESQEINSEVNIGSSNEVHIQSNDGRSEQKISDSSEKESTNENQVHETAKVEQKDAIDEYTRETQEFIDQYLTPLTNIKLVKINKEIPLDSKPYVVLAVPILFNEHAIRAIGKMLTQLPATDGQTPIVYYQIIQQTKDFENLREYTGIDFRNKDNIYNTIAIHHEFLGQHMVYRLSDIINPQKRIFHDFKSIKPVHSSEELKNLISDLETDELLVGLCHTDQFETRKRFGELLFKNYNLDVNKIVAVDIKDDGIVSECQPNGLVAYFKSKHFNKGNTADDTTVNTITLNGLDSRSVSDITNELGQTLNEKSIFKNNIVNVSPKHYRVEITIDSNTQDKREFEKMEALFQGVKDKLGDKVSEFEFVLIKRSLQNSEKDRRPIYGFDTNLIQKQMQYFYQNTEAEIAEQLKKEDPRIENLSEQLYQYPFNSLTTSNVVEFCHQLLEGRATPARVSQKAPDFQRYSRRVVGKDFKENIVDNDKDQVIFYYSKNCGSCKRFLPLFEELAYENFHYKDSPKMFNRINNDENQNPHQEIYVSTPKIVIYRNGFKQKPYEYRSSMLNKTMLAQFINITLGFDLLESTANYQQFASGAVDYMKDLAQTQLSEI